MLRRISMAAALVAAAVSTALVATPTADAATDKFFVVPASQVAKAAPGDVLRTREVSFHVSGINTPIKVTQLVYRTVDALDQPIANVTSVLHPPQAQRTVRAVAYNSIYDSLNPEDSPSRAIAGRATFSSALNTAEVTNIVSLLTAGYTTIISDIEGPDAHFAAGREYATTTLDGIRAAGRSSATGVTERTKVALMGYSGGSIATNWAAALAPSYAPDVNRRLVGAAGGGLLVSPLNNLDYISGSLGWSGVAPMAIIGLARAYNIDPQPYLSARGKQIFAQLDQAAIPNVLFQYPGLTWKELAKPQYADPLAIPPLKKIKDDIDLAQAPTPKIPLFMMQGGGGWQEGTNGSQPGIGAGDGVMIVKDNNKLLQRYCRTGNRKISYTVIDWAGHNVTMLQWGSKAVEWIGDRFAGRAAPSTCR